MTCEEIKISLHDYVDGQLNLVTKNEVKNHLYGCDLCFKEYQRIQSFFEILKSLPYTLKPKEDIVADFSKELLDKSLRESGDDLNISHSAKKKIEKEQRKQEAKLKADWSVSKKSRASKTITVPIYSLKYISMRRNRNRLFLLSIIIVLLAAAYFIYNFQKRNSPWNFEILSGNVLVNGKQMPANILTENETIRTQDNAQAIIFIPQTGKIQLMPASEITIIKAEDGDNKIKLNGGTIHVISSADMPDLTVEFSLAEVRDRSGTFTLTATAEKKALLNVEAGFVEINYGDEKIFVKDGYTCKLLSGGVPSIPYRINAPDSLKNMVENFSAAEDNSSVADLIISSAGKDDMLTLLAMIPRVSQLQRQIIFQTIANHFPPPANVTRLGILKADEDMLYKWWEDMEWQL